MVVQLMFKLLFVILKNLSSLGPAANRDREELLVCWNNSCFFAFTNICFLFNFFFFLLYYIS
jgi:hypothetical protein